MKKICSFIINNKIYTIYDVYRIRGKKSYVGQSRYDQGMIFIEIGNIKNMLITLKHELMHVWLYENGHTNQNNDEIFNYEDLCELAALSNDSINKVVKAYCRAKNIML